MHAPVLEALEPRLMLSAVESADAPPTTTGSLQQQRRKARLKRAASSLVVSGGSVAEGSPGQAAFARVLIEDTDRTNNTRFLGFLQIKSTHPR